MNLMTRGELRRAMLAQLANQPPGASLTVDAVISAFVEQLVALRDSFERDVARVARLQAVLEVELAAANRELNDLRAELDDREDRDRTSNITTLRKPSDAKSTKRTP